jgi:hypothetical protein
VRTVSLPQNRRMQTKSEERGRTLCAQGYEKQEHQKENTTSGKHVETKEKSVRDDGQKMNATQSQIWLVNSDRVVPTQNGEENIAHPRFKR